MNKRVKGYAANPVGIVLLCAVCVAAGAAGMYLIMSANQGGFNDDDGDSIIPEETMFTDEVPSETILETETEPTTEPVTVNDDYICVIVDENSYIYNDKTFTLEEFIGIVKANPDITVQVIDEGAASIDAYDSLITALEQLKNIGVGYVESRK